MSAASGLRALPVALTTALCLVLLVATAAGAATDVEDAYQVTLAPGATVADDLRIQVPDEPDADLAWRVAVAGPAGGGCPGFTLLLVDATGAEGLVLTGARADDDGRLRVGVRVLAADDAGRPTPAGTHRCALRLDAGDVAQVARVVEVTLRVEADDAETTTTSSSTTTTTTSTTLAPPAAVAAPTTTVAEPTTTSGPTTTTTPVVAPVAATGDSDQGGLPSSGPGALLGAAVVAAFGLLLLGSGLVATSQRPPPAPPGGPGRGPTDRPDGGPGGVVTAPGPARRR